MRDAKKDLTICNKATPGPWVAEFDSNGDCKITVGARVIFVPGTGEDDDNLEADARFIVTAREALFYWIERVQQAEEAIECLRSMLYEQHANSWKRQIAYRRILGKDDVCPNCQEEAD